eukprot:6253570-Prymnesium_polylepis.2
MTVHGVRAARRGTTHAAASVHVHRACAPRSASSTARSAKEGAIAACARALTVEHVVNVSQHGDVGIEEEEGVVLGEAPDVQLGVQIAVVVDVAPASLPHPVARDVGPRRLDDPHARHPERCADGTLLHAAAGYQRGDLAHDSRQRASSERAATRVCEATAEVTRSSVRQSLTG